MKAFTYFATRATVVGLGAALLLSGHAAAQQPGFAPPQPNWTVDADSGSMSLSPVSSKLALGTRAARATLHVMGVPVSKSPGTGYVVLGPADYIHMQLDGNDIRVAGPTKDTYGPMHLQRTGGPMVVHGSLPLDSRLYITEEGDLGVATANPLKFAVDRQLFSADWPKPPGVIAVDGDVWADQVRTRGLQVLDRVRIGRPASPSKAGTTWDRHYTGALLQVGGKITAQSIVVHLDSWADDVFAADYPLMPLRELETYIEREGHLPGVPTEATAMASGLDVATSHEVLLRKVEELTLYTVAQQREIEELERRLDALVK